METQSRYIDEEYREKLDALATENPDASRKWIGEQFVQICREIEETTKDETPIEAVRRIAYNQLTAKSGPL